MEKTFRGTDNGFKDPVSIPQEYAFRYQKGHYPRGN
jgi:hypothetical protein